MQSKRTLKLALPALLCAALLTACAGNERPNTALPPVERAQPVDWPTVPKGEADCAGAPCLSDAQAGELMADFGEALREANRRLRWLRDYIEGAE